MSQTNITFPVGRLVWGSLTKPRDKDAEGRPLVYKSGADAGKPRVDYSFGVAIPKQAGQHWAQSTWGQVLWQVGHAFRADAGTVAGFSWKVKDGDSTDATERGGRMCDRPGYAGHWIVSFSSAFAPRVVDGLAANYPDITAENRVNPGDYVQVAGSVKNNSSTQRPGILINHNVVCFSGYGERIQTGVDVASMGFQTGPAAGASQVPVGGMPASVAAPPVAAPVPPAVPSVAAPVAPAPTVVTPNPSFVPPPPAATVPAAPAARVMLPAAGGATYEQMRGAGWTDEQLVQHGMMQA